MNELRVAIAGDEAAGSRALALVRRSPHEPVLVAAAPPIDDDARSLWTKATKLAIPCIAGRDLRSAETADVFEHHRVDVLLNVHSLHRVAAEVLESCRVGAWNLHPGPLPEGAGINVPSWAIAEDWDTTGVTVHEMTAEYDAGAIAYEERFPVADVATGLSLSLDCARRGLGLIDRLLGALADDGPPRRPQDMGARVQFHVGQPDDGVLDWHRSANELARFVRAADFRPFPSPWAAYCGQVGDGRMITVDEARVGEPCVGTTPGTLVEGGDLARVATSDRWLELAAWAIVKD